jgi:SnoaL-like domain/SnoaL-like polyketide cyclase
MSILRPTRAHDVTNNAREFLRLSSSLLQFSNPFDRSLGMKMLPGLLLISGLFACGGTSAKAVAPTAATAESARPTSSAEAPKMSMQELQIRSLREYVSAFNRHDAKAVAALYAADAAFIERGVPGSSGRNAIESNYKDYFDTYPDVKAAITRSWHWGDTALFEYVEGGTQSGERIVLPPAPHRLDPMAQTEDKTPNRTIKKATGKKFGYVGASLLHFTPEGAIRQDMTYADELTREVQSGLAPTALAKFPVREAIAVPAASEQWETHTVSVEQMQKSKSAAARESLYKKFSVRSEKEFLGALSSDVVIASFDDPKDAKGKTEATALLKDWNTTFADGVVDATEAWTVDGYVVLVGTYGGKHVGAWGPLKPTKKAFKTHFLDILKVNKDDKVERLWSYANNYELLQSLGYESGQ